MKTLIVFKLFHRLNCSLPKLEKTTNFPNLKKKKKQKEKKIFNDNFVTSQKSDFYFIFFFVTFV